MRSITADMRRFKWGRLRAFPICGKGYDMKKSAQNWKWWLPFYIMMLPGMFYFLVNNYLPMAGIVVAFKKVNYRLGIFASPWNGVKNFEFLFKSGAVGTMVRNTVLYNMAFILIDTVLAIAVAILLNEIRKKYASRIYQTLILLPYLMSMVIVSYLAFAFLSGETGFINNSILKPLGLEPISFYQEQAYWPFILTFVHVWKGIGFTSIVYFAAVVGISEDMYESARVEGASRLQQIRYITLPSLKPTVITLFILSISKMFFSDFGLFYQIPKNSGILYPVTQTIDTYVYNALMNQNNPGMSAAAGFVQSVVGCVLVIAANALIRRISREDAMF